MKVSPMKYHSPGWKLETAYAEFLVWGPNEKRPDWQACWQNLAGDVGAFERGESIERAMERAGFPTDVQDAFYGREQAR